MTDVLQQVWADGPLWVIWLIQFFSIEFKALFNAMEPAWAPKAIATLFVLLGVFLIWMAERRACVVAGRLNTHAARDMKQMNLKLIALAIGAGSLGLVAGIWLLV